MSKTRKTPRLCGFSFWEVFQLGLATRIPTMYTLSLSQLNASVVYDFLTCTLFSAATAYAYVFKEICISESLREMKTNPLFLMGSCFALFSQVKEAKETFRLAKVPSGIASLFLSQVQILQSAVRRREGGKKSF